MLRSGECPRHLALIMDGNRRYAQVRRKLPHEGHQMGFGTLEQVWMVRAVGHSSCVGLRVLDR
jgi:undecaprenyl diphosphate synthase